MTLKRDFKIAKDASGATRLREQLIAFAGDVQNSFDGVVAIMMRRIRVAVRISNQEGLTLAPGESIGIIAAVTRVQLALPGPQDAGKFSVLCQAPGIAVTTTVYAPARTLISGVSAYVLPATGRAYLFYCDGVDYWTTQ